MKSSTSVLLEKPTPRLVIDDIPKTLWAIAIVAFWERFSFWGVTVPFQNHMEHPWSSGSHEKPGVLGLGQSMATSVNCAFRILYYVTPIIWAVVSDSWLGRYKSLCYTFILYILGIGVLVGSSFYVAVERGFALPGLLLAMVLIALGGGGCRAIMVPFIADQYVNREPRLKTLKSGEVVITDPVLTLEYIYSLYFWLGNLGSFSIIASTYIEMHVSFWCAYSICLGAMIIALIILLGGRNYYTKVQREENILPAATRILICAARNSFKLKRATPEYQSQLCGVSVPWSEKTVTELGRVLRTCKILLAFVVFWTCFDQMDTNLISQASHLISGPIPNDMMTVINAAGCVVFGPIIQSGLYPILRRHNIVFKPMLKITVGFAIIALSMGYAAIVQGLIYSASPDRISVWIQAPIYIFIAVGEIFCYVTALEYADSHAPEGMRVLVQAISLVIAGIGNALAMALSPLARDPNLIAFYGALLGAMTATTVGFWFWFREYDNLEHSDSMIGEIEQSLEMDIEKASSMSSVTATSSGTSTPVSCKSSVSHFKMLDVELDKSTEDLFEVRSSVEQNNELRKIGYRKSISSSYANHFKKLTRATSDIDSVEISINDDDLPTSPLLYKTPLPSESPAENDRSDSERRSTSIDITSSWRTTSPLPRTKLSCRVPPETAAWLRKYWHHSNDEAPDADSGGPALNLAHVDGRIFREE